MGGEFERKLLDITSEHRHSNKFLQVYSFQTQSLKLKISECFLHLKIKSTYKCKEGKKKVEDQTDPTTIFHLNS